MSVFADYLKRRIPSFSINIPIQTDAKIWVENQLLSSPYCLTTVGGISYQTTVLNGREKQVHISVKYVEGVQSGIVFGVKDVFELITAVSISLKCHLPKTVIVIDNRSGFVPENGVADKINTCKEYVGEELEIHQYNSSKSSWKSFFKNRIIIYTLEINYFDSAKDINDLSCILAEQAKRIRSNCGSNPKAIVDSIMKWFRQNIEYKNNNQTADHSAVGLYKNKTAVCQGIAAYAYQLLTFCGLEARYVSGQGDGTGGWGAHGWNMVKLNGIWHHVDYTFELNSLRLSAIKKEREFKKDHRWDENRYSNRRSDELSNARKTLNSSVIILLPEENCISVNGCLMDTTAMHKICVISNGSIYVSLLDVVTVYGGCYALKDNSICIYLGVNSYTIPFDKATYSNGAWYINVLWLQNLNIRIKTDNNAVVLQSDNS